MRRAGWKTVGALWTALSCAAAVCGDEKQSVPVMPGTVNYVEGPVSLDGQGLNKNAVGAVRLEPGHTLTTDTGGKAEILLNAGIFLRLGGNSALQLVSGLKDVEVQLNNGRAIVEVDQISPESSVRIKEHGITANLKATGLYQFDADGDNVRVFEGKAIIVAGNSQVTLTTAHQLSVNTTGRLGRQKFGRPMFEDDLYNWSSLRSAYLAEANVNEASYYEQYGGAPGGPPWWGSGWYWDSWYGGYTFLPGDGIFYSAFGWGFYSPWCVDRAPGYGFGYRYGRWQFHHEFTTDPTQWGRGFHYSTGPHFVNGLYMGPGSTARGFHSASRMAGGRHGFGIFGGRGSRAAGRNGSTHGGMHGGGFHGGGMGHGSASIGGHGGH